MKLDLKVEDAKFQRALRDLSDAKGKPYGEVIKSNARLIGVNLAFQTQPFGKDAGAKQKGEKAVRRDIAKVFADAPRTYELLKATDAEMADAWYSAMKKRDWVEAKRILEASKTRWRNVEISPFDSTLHGKSRNNRGRVNRHVPAQIVSTGATKLRAHTAKKVRMVGFAKAGWATAVSRLTGNTRGIPQFVTRHKSDAKGTARDMSGNANNPHVTLGNDVPYINTACPPQQIAQALAMQREKMIASIDKVLRARAAKFNRS